MNVNGNFDDFRAKMLAFESGISADRFDWYVENLDHKIVPYAQVLRPGRCIRDRDTGKVLSTHLTVREYFQSLGVDELFCEDDRDCISAMQYKSMNALGFVGYQFGEAALQALGYYKPSLSDSTNMLFPPGLQILYRGEVDIIAWRHGRTHILIDSETPAVIASDVNCWEGQFTGKSGVHALEDLFQKKQQEVIMLDLLAKNSAMLKESLVEALPLPAGVTWSGVLAAAHLCGAQGTLCHLRDGRATADEFNTPIQRYLNEFSRYEVPF